MVNVGGIPVQLPHLLLKRRGHLVRRWSSGDRCGVRRWSSGDRERRSGAVVFVVVRLKGRKRGQIENDFILLEDYDVQGIAKDFCICRKRYSIRFCFASRLIGEKPGAETRIRSSLPERVTSFSKKILPDCKCLMNSPPFQSPRSTDLGRGLSCCCCCWPD